MRGDRQAEGLVRDATAAVGMALAAIAATVSPERIVVGGALGLGQPLLVENAVSHAKSLLLAETALTLDVVPAGLGAESVLAGVAAMAHSGRRT